MASTLKKPKVLTILSASALALAGCTFDPFSLWPPGDGSGEPKTGPAKLTGFASEAELLDYFKEQVRRARSHRMYSTMFGGIPLATGEAGADAASGGTETPYTSTNIQEAGVDEGDLFKSDGRHFYVAAGQRLQIVRAAPRDQMALLSKLDFDRPIHSLYLFGTKVLVLAQSYGFGIPGGPELLIWPPYYTGGKLLVAEVDATDPANPTITKQVELDGALAHSRLTDGRLILVLTVLPTLPDDPSPLAVERLTLADLMPKLRVQEATIELVPWQHWVRPTVPDGFQTTAVVTLDAADIETTISTVAVLAGAGTIYASPHALYLTDMAYDPNSVAREKTAIHKLEFGEDGGTRYVASGSVDGRLLNQFSLGEHEGYLRVATHIANWGSRGGGSVVFPAGAVDDGASEPDAPVSSETAAPPQTGPENAVFVLGVNQSQLEVVGEIRGIARGEQLYSARFLGTRGYLVTFIRIDPLFSLDLSDPRSPRIAGELKIPGYSDYLHPLGETHLIGVGRTVEETRFGGVGPGALQLSLFDVSAPSSPRLVQQLAIGGFGSYSEVSHDHRAFALLESGRLLALPASLTPADTTVGWNDYQATVLCFRIDPASGFAELGRLEQAYTQSGESALAVPWWQRAAFIGETMYAVNPEGVRAAEVGSFESYNELFLEP